jgi:chloramphenicol 3-O-phosphotransferase
MNKPADRRGTSHISVGIYEKTARMVDLVQIIYLNGPSSSGKTTLAKALQHAFEKPFLHVGIDKIIGWMPEKINDWTGKEAPLGYSWKKGQDESGNPIQELQAGPYAQKIGETFQQCGSHACKNGTSLNY